MSFWPGLIPRFVPSRLVCLAMRGLSALGGRIPERTRLDHLDENTSVIGRDGHLSGKSTDRHFIENQAELKRISFGASGRGLTDLSYSGCGAIAVWNAITALGIKAPNGDVPDLPRIIYDFEKRYTVRRGRWGSVPTAAASFFKRFPGLSVRVVYGKDAGRLQRLSDSSDVCIVTAFNDINDIRKMVHTVCIEKRPEGFVIHNGYRNVSGRFVESDPYPVFADAVRHIGGGSSVPIVTVGIKNLE